MATGDITHNPLIDGNPSQTAENIRDALQFLSSADNAHTSADFGEPSATVAEGRSLVLRCIVNAAAALAETLDEGKVSHG